MNAQIDYDLMMTDALDGKLNASDTRRLHEYLDMHPVERRLFDEMLGVDRMLKADPVEMVPVAFTANVMQRAARTRVGRTHLKVLQILFIISIVSVLTVLSGTVLLGFYMLISPAFPQTELLALVALGRACAEFMGAVLGIAVTLLRAIFRQPITWMVVFGMVSIVAIWMRVMAAVLVPGLRVVNP